MKFNPPKWLCYTALLKSTRIWQVNVNVCVIFLYIQKFQVLLFCVFKKNNYGKRKNISFSNYQANYILKDIYFLFTNLPEMAFVTDISGEWRAGLTPHTVWYPTIPARPKVVTIWVKAALGATSPRPITDVRPKLKKQDVKHFIFK